MFTARPYQTDLIDRAREAFRSHRRVLVVAPTGAGKTCVFAMITTAAASKGKRVLILAHRVEIVEQISRALDTMGVRHGRIQPGHVMTADATQVGMVQTISRRLHRMVEPDLLVVDEAHHAISGSYTIITDAWQRAKILGVTATPERLDSRGLEDAFDTMVLGPSVRELIEAGYLSGYTYLCPPSQIDLSSVRTKMGDYAIDDLANAVDQKNITGNAVEHYRKYLDGRPAIAFCVTVKHAQHVAQEFRDAGFRADSVDGSMSRAERSARLSGIGDGSLHVLTSCDLISEGVDIPVVSGAILLRPSQSLGMVMQQIGRVLRLKPDGSSAVILDHVGNAHRHGLPDADREWSLQGKRKSEPASVQTCGVCFRVFENKPNWRINAECGDPGAASPDCLMTPQKEEEAEPGGRKVPEVIDGTLIAITSDPRLTPTAAVAAPIEWARGIDVAAAKGADWKRLLRLADTDDKLRDIARVRGFRPGWVHFIKQQRRARTDKPVPFEPVQVAGIKAPHSLADEMADVFRDITRDMARKMAEKKGEKLKVFVTGYDEISALLTEALGS